MITLFQTNSRRVQVGDLFQSLVTQSGRQSGAALGMLLVDGPQAIVMQGTMILGRPLMMRLGKDKVAYIVAVFAFLLYNDRIKPLL